MTDETPLHPEQRSEVWDAIKDAATLSVAPNFSGFYARIVWDAVPYTGVGWTADACLADLRRQIEPKPRYVPFSDKEYR